MELPMSSFCGSLSSFLSHVESSSHSLLDSLQRRPIPLDSVASSFMRGLGSRVSSASADLEILESMAFGTVSFEELLGHCAEVYKKNQSLVGAVEERLRGFGYVPEIDLDDEDGNLDCFDQMLPGTENGFDSVVHGSVSAAGYAKNIPGEDDIFDESMSLKRLGLSDACLATLASVENDDLKYQGTSSENLASQNNCDNQGNQAYHLSAFEFDKSVKHSSIQDESFSRCILLAAQDDYDKLPSYMKSLASWEDLHEAVTKMNAELVRQGIANGDYSFNENDIEKLGWGRKGRTYLLLLLRMNKLSMEKVDGASIYRVVGDGRLV